MSEKVNVVSTTRGTIQIYLPDLHFRRNWIRKGQKHPIDKKILEDIMYDPGCEYMFKTGMLYIEDMDVKKELYLEPEDAKVPTNILIIDDEKAKKMMEKMPVYEFKAEVEKYSKAQLKNLVDWTVEHKNFNYEKCQILKEITGLDAIKMYELNEKNKEETKTSEPAINPSMKMR